MSDQNQYLQAGPESRTSVKVHHPPGGASNWSLGGGEEPAPAPVRRQPEPAPYQPVQQQYQPQQHQQQPLADQPHTSVKVHHAPGGASSFSLGDYQEPPRQQQPVQAPVQQTQPAPQAQPQQNAPGVHTSVKIHHPPGGASSGSFW